MQIAYFTNQTALNSEIIWKKFLDSCKRFNIVPVENSLDADFALIWSVLWHGRMKPNQAVFDHYKNLNKPVFIIEVGSLKRGTTWKVSVNNITKQGIYANEYNFIPNRDKKLGIKLLDFNFSHSSPILIAGQHDRSLQWTYGGSCRDWINKKITEVRQFTDQLIYVRPHPRNFFRENYGKNIICQVPNKIPNTYDQYDLTFNYKAVINFNSGVGIQTAINGIPIICDETSLAYEVSSTLSNMSKPPIVDRSLWFTKILHTEWTTEEIEHGIPLERLLVHLNLT